MLYTPLISRVTSKLSDKTLSAVGGIWYIWALHSDTLYTSWSHVNAEHIICGNLSYAQDVHRSFAVKERFSAER